MFFILLISLQFYLSLNDKERYDAAVSVIHNFSFLILPYASAQYLLCLKRIMLPARIWGFSENYGYVFLNVLRKYDMCKSRDRETFSSG